MRADAPYKTVNDLLAAIKANPGKFKASGTGQGGIWHLAMAGMLRDLKIDPAAVPWVPSNGAAPGLQDMVAGGVEIAPCSLPEARSLIDAGKVKSLAIMDAKRSALYPNVPTLKEAIGSDWTMGAWRGIVAPKGIPADVRDKLSAAVRKVAASKEYNDFMASRGFGVIYAGPEEFAKLHGQVGRRAGRDDEGRGHRQVTRSACAAGSMKLNDAIFGLVLLALGVRRAVRHPGLSQDPGPAGRPALFPGADRHRPVHRGRPAGAARLAQPGGQPWLAWDDWVRSPRHIAALLVLLGSVVFYIAASGWLGFLPTAALILLALFLVLRVPAGPRACCWPWWPRW